MSREHLALFSLCANVANLLTLLVLLGIAIWGQILNAHIRRLHAEIHADFERRLTALEKRVLAAELGEGGGARRCAPSKA